MRLVNRIGLSPNIKRVPIFGLGCVAGAAGISRAADYVRGYPDQAAALLSVELCSLTLQRDDLSMAYTPGVARVCQAIQADPDSVWNLTVKRNTVAVVTDGSAVLGLGDIGPAAAMPVMEGKALLFKEFGGVDAWPLCLDTNDPDRIVATVEAIAPGFGGINLEDIAAPRCFEVEDRLRASLDIPVFISSDLEFDAGESAGYVARDFVRKLLVRVRKPTATPIHRNGFCLLAEEHGCGNVQAPREQIPECDVECGDSPHRDALLPDVFGGSEISLVGSSNSIGRLAKNVSLQFFVDDAFQECGGVIEGEHVAGAGMIPRANLNQDQIDETQNVGGVRNRWR